MMTFFPFGGVFEAKMDIVWISTEPLRMNLFFARRVRCSVFGVGGRYTTI